MTGPSPIREVSEKTARGYETQLNLRANSLDEPCEVTGPAPTTLYPTRKNYKTHPSFSPPPAPAATNSNKDFEQTMHLIYDLCHNEGITLSTPKFMALISQSLLLPERTPESLKPLIELVKP